MDSATNQLHPFLRAVHWRMALLRVLERIGLMILAACVLALCAAGILLWRGRSALFPAEMLLAAGILCGAIWGVVKRPTLFQAALEVDRQTDSAELFSSALIVARTPDFPGNAWAAAVVANARQRSQAHSMADLKLRQLGGRTWGGIVLAIILVLTVVLLGPAPAQTRNADRTISMGGISREGNENAANSRRQNFIGSPDNRPIILPDPDDLNSNSFGRSETTPADPSQAKTGDANPSDAQASASPSNDGMGGKSSRNHPPANSPNPRLTEDASPSGKTISDKAVATADGTGSSSPSEKSAGGSSNGAMLTAGNAAQPAPRPAPWNAANWPNRIEQARKAVDGGRVPAGYRDLIRNYFSPESISPLLPD